MGTGELSRQVLSGAVRDARAEDAEAMSRLCEQLGYPAQSGAMPQRLVRLQRDPNARALVADAGEGPVGLATVHLRHTINHEAPIAQLTLLVVDEAVARRVRGVSVRPEVQSARGDLLGARPLADRRRGRRRAHRSRVYERIGYRHTGRRWKGLRLRRAVVSLVARFAPLALAASGRRSTPESADDVRGLRGSLCDAAALPRFRIDRGRGHEPADGHRDDGVGDQRRRAHDPPRRRLPSRRPREPLAPDGFRSAE